ncbi:right-handed parallel beta-helix repeat-containing protein [Mesorhizobium sp. M0222]|uniref:right-handed parallel beta-helix repeat-containing protein n=1 Tax=Mesorhizobium sp. M0222 TaxID=2956921 RepID=UPI00333C49F9
MAATPYPLPRETRESAIFVGNGTVGPYGPSLYKIFDTADVKVFAKPLGATVYTDVTANCTIAKVNPASAYDFFTVTFNAIVLASTSWYHQARRTAERSVAVTKAGTITAAELEKELSKQASAESELRRDIDRAVRVMPGEDPITVIPGADGELAKFENGNIVSSGENVDTIVGSTATAVAAAAAAAASEADAEAAAAAAAASAASINLPPVVANTFLQAKPDATGYLARTAAQVKATLGVPYFNVVDYGAVADDATDCTAAFAAVIAAALAAGGGTIYIPRGSYWFANASAELDPGAGKLTFLGDGMDATILHFEEGTAVGTFVAPTYKCIFKNTANTAKGGVAFRHLQFKGTLAGDPGRHGGVPVWLDYYSNVVFDACKFYNLTGMAMDIHYCQRAEVRNSWFQDIAADGPRVRDTPNIIVENNFILRNGDDAIALHTADGSPTGTREGVIVANNHLVNAGCIKVLAGRVVHVVNNRIELGNLAAIQVTTAAGGAEGNYPTRDIVVTGNIILDTLYYNGAFTGGFANNIIVKGAVAAGQASTHGTRPGRYDTTGAVWVYPWDYDEVDVDSGVSVVPPTYGIRVSGNIIRRSRPAVANFSSYGAGTRMWQGVATDPAVTDAHLQSGFGVNMGGSLIGALVTENIIENAQNGISFDNPTYNGQYERVVIARNIIRDATNRGFLCSGAFTIDVTIEDNDIDCDPYRKNANSNLNGTYVAASVPRGIDLGNLIGLKILRNRFRNCSQPLAANNVTQLRIADNILSGQPVAAALGFTNTNKGIGTLEAADGRFVYEIIDADPTSATYGNVTTTQIEASAAMPAAGYYVAGAFVRNNSAAGAGIAGWLRLTNGNAHVLNTDWAVVYAAAALPEPSKALGYIAGAGGAVAQATDKTTGVTLNRPSGAITMQATALAANTAVSFVLTDNVITADDVLILNHKSGGTAGAYTLNAQCVAGSAVITVRNVTAGSLSEAIVIQFGLVQGAIT